MEENRKMRIDIMNRNTIISLAMLYALWQSKKQDLLDLIRPFVLYAVGNTTQINSEINITYVCNYLNFALWSFSSAEITFCIISAISLSVKVLSPCLM